MKYDIFKTENLIKIIPGVILFYSFIFIHEYYNIYEISVISIYSIEELILGFLPIIRPLFAITLIGLLIPIMMYTASDYFDSHYHINKIKTHWLNLWEKEKSKVRSIARFLLTMISSPAIAFFILWKIMNVLIGVFSVDPMKTIFFYYLANMIFLIFIYQALTMASSFIPRFRTIPIAKIVFILAFFTGAEFFDSLGVVLAKERQTKSFISFQYLGENYCTDENLVSIGDTKNYIILRDQSEGANLFFEIVIVTNLEIR